MQIEPADYAPGATQLSWTSTFTTGAGEWQVGFVQALYPSKIEAADLVGLLQFSHSDDVRSGWHRNTVGLHAWIRAHVYRLIKHWRTTRLAEYLQKDTKLAVVLGFRDGTSKLMGANPPSQSRLWEIWNEVFTDDHRDFCRTLAEELIEAAREEGIPAPGEIFQPKQRDVTSKRGEQKLLAEKTKEVWQQTKPFVTDTFYLNRGSNAQIHENAFWEQHTYMGMREDMYAQSGQHSFYIDSSREHTPSASNHRYQLQKHSVEEVRSMLRETTRALIACARHNSELVGSLWAAIDITKGNPFTGDREGHEDIILGYKGGNYHYQWATIQIVGHDIPLVLDALPIERGLSRAEIVDDLLETAMGLVDDLDLVMMDREFDSDSVKDACARHGVHYLNPSRKHASERGTCSDLRKQRKRVHVEEQNSLFGHSRKRVYLPARNAKLFGGDNSADETEPKTRQELLDEFADIGGDVDGMRASSPFDDLVDDLRKDESMRGSDEDVEAYALFETNHPALSTDEESEEAQLAAARGFIARYANRWGIENGYKKIKKFRVRTTSKNPQYRFFNFAFACVLYNVWRLVDLLVKLAIDGGNAEYAPRVDANQFLTVAKKYYGLDPPD